MSDENPPEQPAPPHMRSFGLNSPEFYEATCDPSRRPWIPNGALPRDEASWRPSDRDAWFVRTGSDDEGYGAFREWLAHVQAGRIGEAVNKRAAQDRASEMD